MFDVHVEFIIEVVEGATKLLRHMIKPHQLLKALWASSRRFLFLRRVRYGCGYPIHLSRTALGVVRLREKYNAEKGVASLLS